MSSMIREGYRGYVTSRSFFGERAPQHVQNIVIRDYCRRRGFRYLLSATEYAMEDCYLMLQGALDELTSIEGIVLYSLFLLPPRAEARLAIYDRVFAAGASLHGAVESLGIAAREDAKRFEDIWAVKALAGTNALPPELRQA